MTQNRFNILSIWQVYILGIPFDSMINREHSTWVNNQRKRITKCIQNEFREHKSTFLDSNRSFSTADYVPTIEVYSQKYCYLVHFKLLVTCRSLLLINNSLYFTSYHLNVNTFWSKMKDKISTKWIIKFFIRFLLRGFHIEGYRWSCILTQFFSRLFGCYQPINQTQSHIITSNRSFVCWHYLIV